MNDRRPILFDRALKPEWLDYALAEYAQADDEVALREALRSHLATSVKAGYQLQKTTLQLQRVAGFRSSIPRDRLLAFLVELRQLPPDARASVRVRLLCESNPFVHDLVGVLLKLHDLGQKAVTLGQVTERMADQYGHRGMVPRRVRYVLQTLHNLGAVEHGPNRWVARVAVLRGR
jgi:hypothetical protein